MIIQIGNRGNKSDYLLLNQIQKCKEQSTTEHCRRKELMQFR